MKTEKVKYRNDTGGLLCIPNLAADSPLEGAIKDWTKVEDGKIFMVETSDGEPVNPSLRVLAAATKNGISKK